MAENPFINKVQMADGRVLMDLTQDTITSDHMLEGTTAHAQTGATVQGTIPTYNGNYIIRGDTDGGTTN